MATLRKDGRWMARGKNREGQTIYGYGMTSESAEDDLQGKRSTHSTNDIKTPTLHEIAKAHWYPALGHLKPKSLQKYTALYKNHVRPALGSMLIEDVKGPHVQTLVNTAKGYSVARDLKFIVRQIVLKAMFADLIARDPTVGVTLPRKPAKRQRVLSLEQAEYLFDETRGTDLAAPVFLAVMLGLRQGEIAGLKWSDLDRQKRQLKIERQLQSLKGGVVEVSLKTTSSRRVLSPSAGMIEEIDRRGDLDADWICTMHGHRWTPGTIYDKWIEFRAASGHAWLEAWTFHDLRHGAAGLLRAAGCDVLEVMSVLGHSKPDMSLIYMDETQARRDGAVAKISEMLKFS